MLLYNNSNMKKKQHIDINNINNHILLFGGNDDNTDKYGINTNKDRIFNNVGNSDDINLSSGLYIYHYPHDNKNEITLFMYNEDKVGKIENKIVYQLPNNTTISNKEDILKVIMDNIDEVFPEQNNDNNQQIIKEKFFQFFIQCLRPGYKINNSCFQDNINKQKFISEQLSDVKGKIQTFCSGYLPKNPENNISSKILINNKTNNTIKTKRQSFLSQCQEIIKKQYQQQYDKFIEDRDAIKNSETEFNLYTQIKNLFVC